MSDENDSTADEPELVRNLREELKQQSAALSEERTKRTTLERKDAFRDAGVDPSKGPGKLLFDAYDGDPDPAAVKAKAEEYGITLGEPTRDGGGDGEGDQQQEQQTYTDQERAAMEQMDGATRGDAPDRLPTDPADASREAFDREMATSGSRREAMAKSFNARMVTALANQKKGPGR